MDMDIIEHQARLLRQYLEDYARKGTRIACVSATTQSFITVCDAALRM